MKKWRTGLIWGCIGINPIYLQKSLLTLYSVLHKKKALYSVTDYQDPEEKSYFKCILEEDEVD
jgi:hypothetical protein